MSLQEAMRQMRLELGMTQTDLAQQLGKSFISVNRWENGKGFPSRDNAKSILELAQRCGVSEECYHYLLETLKPNIRRSKSAANYGFPDIDRDFLFQLADGSTNSLYVIEAETYNLLYANRKAEQSAVQYQLDRGKAADECRLLEQNDKRCFHYFGGLSAPCPFCPLDELVQEEYTDKTITIPETNRIFHIHMKQARIKERKVYVIYLTDLTEKDAETHALYELTNEIPGGVGIYHVYHDRRIELVFMNEALFQMIGAERKERLLKDGESDLCLIHSEDKRLLWREIKAALAEKRRVDVTLRMRVIDGRYHLVRLRARLIKKDMEKNTFYCQFQDLTPTQTEPATR